MSELSLGKSWNCRVNNGLGVIVLLYLGIEGCTTVEERHVPVECDVPALVTLPGIQSEALSELEDGTYWTLQTRERRLTDWALQMESMLEVLCEPPS